MLQAQTLPHSVHPGIVFSKGRTRRPVRIAFYSHDTMGLGHTRRNLLIAQHLAKTLNISILLISGARESGSFQLPQGVDYLTLPSLHKNDLGKYSARSLSMSLDEISRLRSKAIWAALKVFKPDMFVVDNVPQGANGELQMVLKKLRKKTTTRVVLGLRDILDEPKQTIKEWKHLDNHQFIDRFFDAIWVYGDPAVFEMAREYDFSKSMSAKISYMGYFDQRARICQGSCVDLQAPYVFCQVGGGQDGAKLARAFVQAVLPKGHHGVLITGPYMPQEVRNYLEAEIAERKDMTMHAFIPEPTQYLAGASRVISMGGYNSVWEALSFEKPLLVVPRVAPRKEQLLRVTSLKKLGLLDYLHPESLSSQAITQWLREDVVAPKGIHQRLRFDALERIAQEIQSLLGEHYALA
jgi:predicted glycosyltransferase